MVYTAEDVIGVTWAIFAVISASVVFAGLPGAGAAEISSCPYIELDIIDHIWSTILPIRRAMTCCSTSRLPRSQEYATPDWSGSSGSASRLCFDIAWSMDISLIHVICIGVPISLIFSHKTLLMASDHTRLCSYLEYIKIF